MRLVMLLPVAIMLGVGFYVFQLDVPAPGDKIVKIAGAIVMFGALPFLVAAVSTGRGTKTKTIVSDAPVTAMPMPAPVSPAPVAQPAAPAKDAEARLTELKQMREQGLITEEELAEQRARVLGDL
jgi:hypothetical protein